MKLDQFNERHTVLTFNSLVVHEKRHAKNRTAKSQDYDTQRHVARTTGNDINTTVHYHICNYPSVGIIYTTTLTHG